MSVVWLRHCRVGLREMNQEPNVPQPDARLRFLRVLGTIWLVIMALTLGGAALAPYLGQIADFVLQQTVHRHWTRFALDAEQPFFDLSTPTRAVQSYYGALYQGNVTSMERLTRGAFREQIRLRVAATATASAFTPYRSFVRTEMQGDREAIVFEKFHLFWKHGLRFLLQREAGDWQIVGVEPLLGLVQP
jgi:hypothetical protein